MFNNKNNLKFRKMKHNSITTIKCRFSNGVHKMIDPYYGIKKSDRWKHRPKKLTDAEKVKLFDEIVIFHKECSEEISRGLFKRRERNRKRKLREANGYVRKKKTSKEDYEKSLQAH